MTQQDSVIQDLDPESMNPAFALQDKDPVNYYA